MDNLVVCGGQPVRNRPFPSWPQYDFEEREAILKVFDANTAAYAGIDAWEEDGAFRLAFEKEFAEYHGCRYGITTISGTSAVMVALRALGVEPGDEVLIQSYMCIADTEAIIQVGAVPVFCDLDPHNYGINLDRLEQCITPRTKAMIAIHYGGYLLDMDKIHSLAIRYNLQVIEDACLAHGAEWNHSRVGNESRMTVFSFGIDKLVTMGEGGIIVTKDRELAAFCDSLRNSGNPSSLDAEVEDCKGKVDFYDIKRIGWNFRLTEFPAALGLSSFKKMPEQIARRNENGLYLNEKLKEIEGLIPLERDPRQTLHPHGLYLFKIKKDVFGVDKKTFLRAVRAEGIPMMYGYSKPVYKHSVFQTNPRHQGLYQEETERACEEGIWIGQSLLLGNREDMDDIVAACRKVKEKVSVLKGMSL